MNIPYFDAHCDTVSAMLETGQQFQQNGLHVDLKRGARYLPRAQFFALFADLNTEAISGSRDATAETYKLYESFSRMLQQNINATVFCKNITDLTRAEAEGKLAVFLAIEGAELLNCDLSCLEAFYRDGLRMLTLTWNYKNALSGSHAEHPELGLTIKGEHFVRKCKELGIIVDVSHLSPKGFWDVAQLMGDTPFVASHSNAAHVWKHSRNLKDEQFLAIVKARGVCGINLYADFLGENADIDTVVAHIEHFLSLGGEKSIAIGADFDGCDRLPFGIEGVQDIYKIAERLLQKNCSEALIYDIFYNNLKRVVGEICVI